MLKTLLAGAGIALLTAVPAFAACTEISSKIIKLTGCVDNEWKPAEGSPAQEFAYYTADGNFGLSIISEQQSFAAAQFRGAILQNATNATNGDATAVQVVREGIVSIDGKPFNVIEYTVPNDGNTILFQNFYYSAPDYGSLQVLLFSLATEATASAFRAGTFAATLKIGG